MADKHWCKIHNTKFFKTEKMSGYAHPVKDAGGELLSWCNEDAEEVAKLPEQKPESPPPQPGEELPAPAPQAVGMITKELGDMIRAKLLTEIFGSKIANGLLGWYRSQTLGITRIPYDGKDLPVFK